MVESAAQLSFAPKLKYEPLLIIEVFLNIEYEKGSDFLFQLNKHSRNFLIENLAKINRGYENEGLITHKIDTSTFFGCLMFEKLYLQTLKRRIENRNLTLEVHFSREEEVARFNRILGAL